MTYREQYGNSGMPVGWGMQPAEDHDLTWTDKAHQGSGLRIATAVESGGPVVSTPTRGTGRESVGWTEDMKPYRGFVGQCWCGRTYDLVTADMVKRLVTFACRYERCRQIAAMSAQARLRYRPRPVAHMRLLYPVRGTGSRRHRSGALDAPAYTTPPPQT